MTDELRTSDRGPSIWTRPERSARGPSPEHSRAEIASAGITLADASGLGAVTMRSVAAAIGTAPASLYRYVATRDELVELMADQVYGEYCYDEAGWGVRSPTCSGWLIRAAPSTTGTRGCSTSAPPGTFPGRTRSPSSSRRWPRWPEQA